MLQGVPWTAAAVRHPGVAKHPGSLEHIDDDHHPHEQGQRVRIDRRERFALVEHAEQVHQPAAREGDDRPVEPLADDDGVGDDKDRRRDRQVRHGAFRSPFPGGMSLQRKRTQKGTATWQSPPSAARIRGARPPRARKRTR
jgi:hypothetical protein